MSLNIRRATPADSAALSVVIKNAFDGIAKAHNFPLDFVSPEMATGLADGFLNHPKIYGVVAENDGKVVGSNFLDERNVIPAVGPISVDPGAQAKGVGRRLMQAVIERGKSAPGIRLVQDAFNMRSMSLYTSLGFDVKEPLALMSGKSCSVMPANIDVRPLEEADLPACAVLCQKVHGFDRTNELRDSNGMFHSQVLVRGNRLPHIWQRLRCGSSIMLLQRRNRTCATLCLAPAPPHLPRFRSCCPRGNPNSSAGVLARGFA